MYKLTKLDSTKENDYYGVVLSHGRHTQALRVNFEESHKLEFNETTIQEPTVGACLLVENIKEWYRTNVVTEIRSDVTNKEGIRTVVFETASGSVYQWDADCD